MADAPSTTGSAPAGPTRPGPTDGLVARLLAGERAGLARALTLVESDGPTAAAIHRAVAPHAGRTLVLGFTGPPGVGKSSLIDALVGEIRKTGARVAILAVDPSSPITGGAVLGDRVRMGRHSEDDSVFIRSLAARGHLGGLTSGIHRLIDVLDAGGWDMVVLETVGAGQSEVEIAEIADIRVVITAPGQGDDVQAMKTGILEIADILVVNKADMKLADSAVRQLRAMLKLRAGDAAQVPVVKTVATDGTGVADLLDAITARREHAAPPQRSSRKELRARRLIAQAAGRMVHKRLLALDSPALDGICNDAATGACDIETSAEAALRLVAPPRR